MSARVAGWVMPNCNWSTVQWLSQNLRMPLAPVGVSPLHRVIIKYLSTRLSAKLYSTDKPSITQIVQEIDENLFNSIRYNPSHLLHQLLPRRNESSYSLRSRPHNFELSHIHDDRNFIERMLFIHSLSQRVTSYPSYLGYTDIILTLLCILLST